MATYAALVSLTNLIDQIQLYHVQKPSFTTRIVLAQVQNFQEIVTFCQDFLESYNPRGGVLSEDLERRIADSSYQAQDIIESYMVDDIDAQILNIIESHNSRGLLSKDLIRQITDTTSYSEYTIDKDTADDINNQILIPKNYNLSSDLGEVIDSMYSIREEVAEIKKNGEPLNDDQRQDLVPVGPARSTTMENDTTVLFDDELNEIMAKILGQGSCLQILSIIGMGGIGKTTLAKHAYDSTYVTEYFDIRGWITISQVYDTREILLGLAFDVGVHIDNNLKENIECHQLVEKLYKHLSGRRYLIMIDDMWDTQAWDELKASFPRNDNGSCVMVTSRLSSVANYVGSSDIYHMNLLDDDKSWRLLCRKVFVRECCPLELEEIGKKIAKSCKGLPLSIVVIGGFLAKSEMTQEYWEYVAQNINTTINLEDDDRCFQILSLSYRHLPVHLKPCFLYMGVFPEDHKIRVKELIRLWVAEGFLKLNREKSLEEVAENYLKDLIGRNLIFARKGSTGNLKTCKIHDVSRDWCLREARRERFFCVSNSTVHNQDSQGLECRIAIHPSATNSSEIYCASFPRTVLNITSKLASSINSKFLTKYSEESISEVIISSNNSRYLNFGDRISPDGLGLYWNQQTVVIKNYEEGRTASSEIWAMPQLRHVMIQNIYLPDPPIGITNGIVLGNLQTLSCIYNFRCTEEVLRRIPNIKKLKVHYFQHEKGLSHYFSKNLEHLHKLQSLKCSLYGWATRSDLLQNLGFSTSLKKLTLYRCDLDWEDMATKIGPLPNLEKLRLSSGFEGEEWSPVEGQFLRLKFLEIRLSGLVRWIAEDTHFPCLERLVLACMWELEEIPSGFADIATLQLIMLAGCKKSVNASAVKILEEQQQNLGYVNCRLFVRNFEWIRGTSEAEEGGELQNEDLRRLLMHRAHKSDGWFSC